MKTLGWLLAAMLVAAPAGATEDFPLGLPIVERVRVEVSVKSIVVTEDISFDSHVTKASVDLYVAFGSPGLPGAFEPALVIEQETGISVVPIDWEKASEKPKKAQLLLGSPKMAGALLHVKTHGFATARNTRLLLRIRSAMPLPAVDSTGTRGIVVRLGSITFEPWAVRALEMQTFGDGAPELRDVSARYCLESEDGAPLYVRTARREEQLEPRRVRSPILSERRAGDSVCFRFRTEKSK